MRAGFLFNHYAAHQVPHSAPIAFALSQRHPEINVLIMASKPELLDAARAIGALYPGHRCQFVQLRVSRLTTFSELLAGRWLFLRRKSTLRANLKLFATLDVLVVPEKNSLALKRCLPRLKMVRIRHGAGDRETGLDDSNACFDLVLASGRKMCDRLADTVPPGRCVIVGYPKFEVVAALPPPVPVFANGRPTVLYNPHFRPDESSWPEMGLAVLDYFRMHPEYNLIFAPHIMLYKRGREHSARDLSRFAACPNIHLDIGSLASNDMSYTRQADIYLGDVSSQVYEFMQTPRPCIFLNAHKVDWQEDINFTHWRAGQVVDDIGQLGSALHNAPTVQPSFTVIQQDLFGYTFDKNKTPPSTRAADAVFNLLSHSG